MLTGLTKWLERPGIQLAILLVFGVIYRMSTFGHPTMDDDETFYFLMGQEMHRGMIPYVDLWDRKPLGLFILFYLIALFSESIVAYQIVACLCAVGTGWVISQIATAHCSPRAGLMAGLIYIAALPFFWGWGGQTPIFYNLLIATAAWLTIVAMPQLSSGKSAIRADLAMLVCGIAITIKQTTLVESAFFGLCCAYAVFQSPMNGRSKAYNIAKWVVLGILPTLLIATTYWSIGHFAEYWHAMFTSNFAKHPATPATIASRGIGLYLRMAPLLCTCLIGIMLVTHGPNANKGRRFLIGWLLAAWAGFFLVPNFYVHYALPLLVPLCVASARLFSRRDIGLTFFVVLCGLFVGRYDFLNFERTRQAQAAMDNLSQAILDHDNNRDLFIYDGPVLLYWLTDHKPMTPLALPLHLNYALEENVSHLETSQEVAKVLARRPGVILVSAEPRNNPVNETTLEMVNQYIDTNCRLVAGQWSPEMFRSDKILVYGDCAAAAQSR